MAWTTPKTWTTEALTSTDMNTHIRDNLNALKAPPTVTVKIDNPANYTNAAAGWQRFHTSDFDLNITTTGGDVLLGGFFVLSNAGGSVQWDIEVDGVRWGGDSGIGFVAVGTFGHISPSILLTSVSSGAHTIRPLWLRTAGTATLYAGNYHGQFWAREI